MAFAKAFALPVRSFARCALTLCKRTASVQAVRTARMRTLRVQAFCLQVYGNMDANDWQQQPV
jgi:hypothetical protein